MSQDNLLAGTHQNSERDTTNNELVEHKDESPSMVDKVART